MEKRVPVFVLYGEHPDEGPDFRVHCETIASRSSAHRWEIKPHRHQDFFQILYIRNGVGDMMLADRTLDLVPPCLITVPPGVVHGYRFSQDVEGFVVTVAAEQFHLNIDRDHRATGWLRQAHILPLGGRDGEYVEANIQRIAQELDLRHSGYRRLVEAYLSTVLLLVERHIDSSASVGDADQTSARIRKLKDLIARDFRNQHPVTHYATLLGLSPAHLNRVVRSATGRTVHELVMDQVVDEARRGLILTSASVQQIGENLGFADAGYFCRCFRKRTGQTPGGFRRSERQKLAVG